MYFLLFFFLPPPLLRYVSFYICCFLVPMLYSILHNTGRLFLFFLLVLHFSMVTSFEDELRISVYKELVHMTKFLYLKAFIISSGSDTPDLSAFLFDATSGFYYDPLTTLYYDPNSRVCLEMFSLRSRRIIRFWHYVELVLIWPRS